MGTIKNAANEVAASTLNTAKWLEEVLQALNLFRRIAFCWAIALTTYSYWWAVEFAINEVDRSGSEIGMIIAAILGPMSGLQAFILRTYATTKNPDLK